MVPVAGDARDEQASRGKAATREYCWVARVAMVPPKLAYSGMHSSYLKGSSVWHMQ